MFTISFQEKIFTYIIYTSYLLYFLSLLGISMNAGNYLNYLEYFIKIYVSLFLIIRFNPFRNITFTNLDRRIAFSAGLFILTTSLLNQFVGYYLDTVKNKLTQKMIKYHSHSHK